MKNQNQNPGPQQNNFLAQESAQDMQAIFEKYFPAKNEGALARQAFEIAQLAHRKFYSKMGWEQFLSTIRTTRPDLKMANFGMLLPGLAFSQMQSKKLTLGALALAKAAHRKAPTQVELSSTAQGEAQPKPLPEIQQQPVAAKGKGESGMENETEPDAQALQENLENFAQMQRMQAIAQQNAAQMQQAKFRARQAASGGGMGATMGKILAGTGIAATAGAIGFEDAHETGPALKSGLELGCNFLGKFLDFFC